MVWVLDSRNWWQVMVSRYQPRAGMVSADYGDYVESVAYDELLAQYQSLYDTAVAYLDMVGCGEMTVDQAKAALLAVRRLGGQ